MSALRLLATGLAAAVLGCVAAALVLVGRIDQTSFIPVPVLWAGTLLLLAPVDRLLRTRGLAMPLRAVPLIGAGAVGFAALAWLLAGGSAGSAVMGGVYGLVTGACWAAMVALFGRGARPD